MESWNRPWTLVKNTGKIQIRSAVRAPGAGWHNADHYNMVMAEVNIRER
jgi:hypothetical protein